MTQQFGYDAHDKLMSGLGESESYDTNGNLKTQSLNGQGTSYSCDDEDRLTSITLPDGHTDSFSYNGLGMRLSKSDPTGNYWYFTDGVSPASDVLTDNYSTFTPGIGETKGAAGGGYASEFYLADASGNSRGLLNGSGSSTDGYNWDAFGNLVSRFGTNPTGFAWNVSSGYQTDNDDGLTLLGHRYYDKRTGRFISQDHAKDGGNWYRYASNNPVNKTDPTGLSDGLPGSLGAPDSHYGGLGGFLDGGAEGLNSLNSFWDSENASEIRGSTEYAASVAISKAVISGPPSFQSYVKGLLNQIASSQFGAQLLADSLYKIVLKISPLYGVPNSEYHGIDNKFILDGTYNTVLFNPSLVLNVRTTDGWTPMPPDVILEHEVGHAVGGLGDPSVDQNIYTTNGIDNISEYENPYRQEKGLPIRVDHFGQVISY